MQSEAKRLIRAVQRVKDPSIRIQIESDLSQKRMQLK